jgi:hypothetical protein
MELQRMTVLAQVDNGDVGGAGGTLVLLIQLAVVVLTVAGLWKVFTKAGKPGWAAIIPIYNVIVLLDIVGKPLWWVILFLIPCVNIVISIIVYIELAKVFGQGAGFAIGILLLPFVFIPLLGFGDYRYQGAPA